MKKLLVWILPLFLGGWVFTSPGNAEVNAPFDGSIDFNQRTMAFNLTQDGQQIISLRLFPVAENRFQMELVLNHFKTPYFDVSTEFKGFVDLITREDHSNIIKGDLSSQYSLIDYKPFRDVSGSFEIRDNQLKLWNLTFGGIVCDGTIDLSKGIAANLNVRLNNLPMEQFLSFFSDKETQSAGSVSGIIHFSGSPDNLNVSGQLSTYDGYVNDLAYNSILINFEGIFPAIQLLDSSLVTLDDGQSFLLSGPIHLNQRGNFKEQIAALNRSPLIQQGAEGAEWTIKRHIAENDTGSTELKYLQRTDTKSDVPNKIADMIGFEKNMKF